MSTNITLESAGTQIFVAQDVSLGTEKTKTIIRDRATKKHLTSVFLLIINAIPKNTIIQKAGEASQAKNRDSIKNIR